MSYFRAIFVAIISNHSHHFSAAITPLHEVRGAAECDPLTRRLSVVPGGSRSSPEPAQWYSPRRVSIHLSPRPAPLRQEKGPHLTGQSPAASLVTEGRSQGGRHPRPTPPDRGNGVSSLPEPT